MSVIRWEDPPPSRMKEGRFNPLAISHELIASQLKRRPGEWGLIAEQPSNQGLAAYVKAGRYRPYAPPGAFDAVTRDGEDGVRRVYARYVGEASDAG